MLDDSSLSFICLGTRGLNEPDEGRYAEIAREMLEDGDWLVPHLNGFAHMQKPPFIYWLTAASLRCFGNNEWAARLPSALGAIGTVWMTFLISRRLWGRHRAHVTAFMLMCSVGFFVMGRLLTPDMVMCFWITASIAALVHHRPWLFFVCMGLGFLTKGPMALMVPISAALGYQLTGGIRPGWPWKRGLLLAIMIGLSWFVVVCIRHPELWHYYLQDEVVSRIASHSHGRSKPWWFFIPILFVSLLPWSLCTPRVVRQAVRALCRRQFAPRHGLLIGWVLLPFLILSLSGSKLATYALPLLPALLIAYCPPAIDLRRLTRLGISAALVWVTLMAATPMLNDHLGRQASIKTLAQRLQGTLHEAPGEIFLCGTRAHGIEFYLQRLVTITRNEADMMIPPTPQARLRLQEDARACAANLSNRPAYGIMLADCYEKHFAPKGWKLADREGDYVLASIRIQ